MASRCCNPPRWPVALEVHLARRPRCCKGHQLSARTVLLAQPTSAHLQIFLHRKERTPRHQQPPLSLATTLRRASLLATGRRDLRSHTFNLAPDVLPCSTSLSTSEAPAAPFHPKSVNPSSKPPTPTFSTGVFSSTAPRSWTVALPCSPRSPPVSQPATQTPARSSSLPASLYSSSPKPQMIIEPSYHPPRSPSLIHRQQQLATPPHRSGTACVVLPAQILPTLTRRSPRSVDAR